VKAPLYQVLLSVVVRSPLGYEDTAGLVHVLLACVTTAALWWLVRAMHSTGAAYLAAGVYAVYVPSIVSANAIMQERLYIPLMVSGFAVLSWAILRSDRAWRFAAAGSVMALAALTRSMPLCFAVPCALLIGVSSADRGRGVLAPTVAQVAAYHWQRLVVDPSGLCLETAQLVPGTGRRLRVPRPPSLSPASRSPHRDGSTS
jgi:4-amino-4-deoxy-L-arabinose transferase-like glycosyltransferase